MKRIGFASAVACFCLLGVGLASCADDTSSSERVGASTGRTPDASTPAKVSKPGEYSGYSERIYEGYELSSRYVAVRDGTKLAVDLYRPKDESGQVVNTKLPVLLMHTPYNRRYFESATTGRGLSGETYPGAAARLIEYGYVVAIADFRGLYASYGRNVGYNRGEWLEAARMDAYDLVEWLAEQPWSTGKVGMWGCSATGGSQMQAATTAPPHLKAIFPMSCEFDIYEFAVMGGVAPPPGMATSTPPNTPSSDDRNMLAQPVDGDDDRTQLMAAIAEHADGKDSVGFAPFRDSVASNVLEGPWWQQSSPHTYLDEINESGIAVYAAANWDEGSSKGGVFFTFNNLTTPKKLLVGPAGHCAWFTVQNQTGFDLAVEERRWFDHWLKDIDNGVLQEPPVYYYTYNAPEGTAWRASDSWPLANERQTRYYLGARTITTVRTGAVQAHDELTVQYDVTPDNLLDRGLRYESPYYSVDAQITGHPSVSLWVSSSATDGDFVVTLQDVAPDGTAVSYNTTGRLRASHRKTADPPYNNLGLPWHPSAQADVSPLTDEPVELQFALLPISILIKSGHFLRLIVTFSAGAATPRLDPAPKVRVHRDAQHPSYISLPFIPLE